MVPFALRTLLHDKIRLAIAVGGVGFAVMLILVLRGIMDGTIAKATVYVDKAGADIFISQHGAEHMALSTSILPAGIAESVQQAQGVSSSSAIVSVPVVLKIDGSDAPARLIGFDPAGGLGGPWRVAEGTADIAEDGAVLDQNLAAKHGLHLGDRLQISGQPFLIQGLSSGTSALTGDLVFVRRQQAALLLLGREDLANFVLVKVAPGYKPAAVAASLQTSAGSSVTVQTRSQLSSNERSLLSDLFVTPVNVMATIGFLVGLMVVGLTVYTAASERLKDFGVPKAIGAPNRYLYAVVVRQALAIGLLGFGAGLAGEAIAKPVIESLVPNLGIRLDPRFAAEVLALALLMSLVSAFIPVYRVSSLDPKKVFQT